MERRTVMSAKYIHDCPGCEFIQNLTVEGVMYDIYRCPGRIMGPSWIGRWSSKPSQYWSMPWDVLSTADIENMTPLAQAIYKIADGYEE
jgi:hypothetical protein